MNWNIEAVKAYMLAELAEQKAKWQMGEDNRYSYIYMLCNDMGFTA